MSYCNLIAENQVSDKKILMRDEFTGFNLFRFYYDLVTAEVVIVTLISCS